ncbi:MAG: dTDP-glucose 4,6-dehydratase [Elusimicrobia bacterium RIFCSPLOWO2_01_FULL_59_12]|nr:MAG: dTDP-glucose 4,6-dehydratase [Elusimicrobia bacterium RIFCSPLOWO2_01_FULL_59_12]
MRLLVTGGAGFIGSHFIRHMMRCADVKLLINLDKLTYAGHLDNLKDVSGDRRYRFVRGDIAHAALTERLMAGLDAVVNFAAETHVDRSIQDASPFLRTNVIGVQVLLDAARRARVKRFLHISTDEVYGSIARGAAREAALLDPSSPYSASKAAADHLVLSYFRTYQSPVLITRAANNYGPYQYPEKFLPLFITHALDGKPLPLYGDGQQVRDWLHVSDHCAALEGVLRKGRAGEIYNIGTGTGFKNIEVARLLLKQLSKPASLLRRVTDRPGHDRRYAMSIGKIRSELGWQPRIPFRQGLNDLIDWYADHRSWWEPILHHSKHYKNYYARQYTRR